jgi:hypothetical protein
MRPFDVFRGAEKKQRELIELGDLYKRLQSYIGEAEERRDELCWKAVVYGFNLTGTDSQGLVGKAAYQLCQDILALEGHLYLPAIDINKSFTTGEMWELTAAIKNALVPFEDENKKIFITTALVTLLERLTTGLPQISAREDAWASLSVPFYVLLPDPVKAIETAIEALLNSKLADLGFFGRLRSRLMHNIYTASGIDFNQPEKSKKQVVMPSKANLSSEEVIATYLDGTPLANFIQTPVPFSIPLQARFEHMHIVGGSGHGKTQLLQHLLLHDLDQLKAGKGSIIVIDSQGDMLKNVLSLRSVGEMVDRLVIIDPNDIEFPPALNLFDFGLERLTRYNAVEREKLINGAIARHWFRLIPNAWDREDFCQG